MSLTTISIGTGPRLAVILHGRGASKEDLLPLAEILARDGFRCVLPDAPIPWMGGFAWYESETRARDIPASRALLEKLLQGEALDPKDVIVLGFSQGGVLSLDVSLNTRLSLNAGSLSGYLSSPEAPPDGKGLRVFMAHGTRDALIPIARARESRAELERLGATVEYHEYAMDHEICGPEVEALRRWLA